MKTKGARLTTEISLPGRFVVYVPHGEGLGVSRRLEDDERARLKEIVKGSKLKEGGVIVRTAAEGASAEDIERDLAFLQKLWKSIQERAKAAPTPALVYQEAELPLRVTRDLFTGDFERASSTTTRAYKRIVGYLKKTSPHMVERVQRYKETSAALRGYGVDAGDPLDAQPPRRPAVGRLPDLRLRRGVHRHRRQHRPLRRLALEESGARLEDTITKNNLEAVKEVVRQLRLRDIGGIIVIDFIDMANPKNRATVEEALRTELERDRTKTYVVEISPLGLVEMTRQNVTDGLREIMTTQVPDLRGRRHRRLGGHGGGRARASAARARHAGSRVEGVPRRDRGEDRVACSSGPGASRLAEHRGVDEAAVLPRAERRHPQRPLLGARRGHDREAHARVAGRGGQRGGAQARRGRPLRPARGGRQGRRLRGHGRRRVRSSSARR